MIDLIALLISGASFCLSGYAIWVAQFRRGQLKITQPTLICLKWEQPKQTPKIFLRALLFTTGSVGRVVEGMFLKVHQSHKTFTFDFWGHTEGGKLTLGSGIFVGSTGVACDHHFNPRHESENFLFVDGPYRLEIFASIVGSEKPQKLKEIAFTIGSQQAAELIQINDIALWLRWNADDRNYVGNIERFAPY